MKSHSTRRRFLGGAVNAAVGIGLAAKVLGAEGKAPPSDTIAMASIGIGPMGGGLQGAFLGQKDTRFVAICDVHEPKIKAAMARCARKGQKVQAYGDYRKLLERKDIDAVVVAPPPHWHALIGLAVLQSGRDMYIEKPMTMYVEESKAIVKAAAAGKRITQVGTQIHATPNYRRVVEIVRSGVLGKISTVRTFWNMNTGTKGIGKSPESPPPKGLDWEMFVGPAQMVPFRPNMLRGAFHHCSFMGFSGGWMPGMAPHIVDLPVWALGLGLPTQASCSGGRYVTDDDGDSPDVQEALFQYPGLTMTWMMNTANSYGWDFQGKGGKTRRLGIYFHGENATLYCDYGMHKIVPEAGVAAKLEVPAEPKLPPSVGHHRELLDSIKSRQPTSCNVAYHHKVNVPLCLANAALKLGRSIQFDPKTEAVVGDAEAARACVPVYRAPWKLG
ncbi:MAG: Gfo/Idh/MocA family oxidoreductase [Candidatus Brocadiae bacterium]|nr:Gfo/Idh/MocA family oxidoreductase [Candidatus Brocadiia bacterium]